MPFFGITVENVAEFSESYPTFISLCHYISWNTLIFVLYELQTARYILVLSGGKRHLVNINPIP